jgi:hypothetical protein
MAHAFTILETAAADTGWDTHSMLAVACDFIQQRATRDPALMRAFREYVDGRRDEEMEAHDL